MLTVLLFIAVLFKVDLCGKPIFLWLSHHRVLSRLTIAIRIGNAKASSSAVFIEGRSKAKTLGIGIY